MSGGGPGIQIPSGLLPGGGFQLLDVDAPRCELPAYTQVLLNYI